MVLGKVGGRKAARKECSLKSVFQRFYVHTATFFRQYRPFVYENHYFIYLKGKITNFYYFILILMQGIFVIWYIYIYIYLSFLSISSHFHLYQTTKKSFHFSFTFYSLSFLQQSFLLLSFLSLSLIIQTYPKGLFGREILHDIICYSSLFLNKILDFF